MPAPKGHRKWGGRVAGIPNKRSEFKETVVQLKEQGFDPIQKMIELLPEAKNFFQKLALLKELAPYFRPKRSSVALSGDIDMKLIDRVKELEALPEEELNKIAGK